MASKKRNQRGLGTGSGSSVHPEFKPKSQRELERRIRATNNRIERNKYRQRRAKVMGNESNLEAVVENMTDPKKMK